MKLTTQRPVLLGLALVGAASVAAGVTAATSASASTTPPAHSNGMSSMSMSSSSTSSTSSAAAPASPSPTATTAPHVTPAAGPVTLPEAVSIAVRRTHARLDKVETELGPWGTDYKVKLVRADGTEVKVFVVGRTGQVLSEAQREQAEAGQPDSPDPVDSPDAPDAPDAGTAQ